MSVLVIFLNKPLNFISITFESVKSLSINSVNFNRYIEDADQVDKTTEKIFINGADLISDLYLLSLAEIIYLCRERWILVFPPEELCLFGNSAFMGKNRVTLITSIH